MSPLLPLLGEQGSLWKRSPAECAVWPSGESGTWVSARDGEKGQPQPHTEAECCVALRTLPQLPAEPSSLLGCRVCMSEEVRGLMGDGWLSRLVPRGSEASRCCSTPSWVSEACLSWMWPQAGGGGMWWGALVSDKLQSLALESLGNHRTSLNLSFPICKGRLTLQASEGYRTS